MEPQSTRLPPPPEASVPPWWRVGMVWLIVGGPLVVVVASLCTVAIAVSGAEEVLTRPAVSVKSEQPHLLPAVQGRNHAATPRN
jgi:hypothetical protein